MTGEIFDIKRFSVNDGPGIRCTAFLKGCPLNCIWCHNPEGKHPGPEICCLAYACINCGSCLSACGSGAVQLEGKGAVINRERCVRCGECAAVCPAAALSVKGYSMSPEELIAEFKKEQVFFKASGGGITLSGGDPLFQPLFTKAVLEQAKANGFHTAVETCLYATAAVVGSLMKLVDLWLCDIKVMDDETHRRLTGKSNKQILSNYELLISSGCNILTRVPVIPGYTDSEENLTAIGRYVASVNPAGKVELIFYNPLGQSKYHIYGLDYELAGNKLYTDNQKEKLRELMSGTGVCVQ